MVKLVRRALQKAICFNPNIVCLFEEYDCCLTFFYYLLQVVACPLLSLMSLMESLIMKLDCTVAGS